MCKFLSGITVKNGDVYISKNTDSHSKILEEFGVSDKTLPPEFCAWEFTPPIKNKRYDFEVSLDQWIFNIDSRFPTPNWQGKGREKITIDECKKRASEFIIKTKIAEIKSGRFIIISGGAKVGEISGGAVGGISGGAVGKISGGDVGVIYGDAKVGEISDDAKVGEIYGNVTINFYKKCDIIPKENAVLIDRSDGNNIVIITSFGTFKK